MAKMNSQVLKPCKCGYSGALMGMRDKGFLSLFCPECKTTVEAFTVEGLATAWNEKAVAEELTDE